MPEWVPHSDALCFIVVRWLVGGWDLGRHSAIIIFFAFLFLVVKVIILVDELEVGLKFGQFADKLNPGA